MGTTSQRRALAGLRGVLIVTIILSAATILWCLPMREIAEGLRLWSEDLGAMSGLVYVGSFVAFTICCLPVWPMPFLAGGLFGPVWGTLAASAGCVIAATVTYWIARLLGRTRWRRVLERSPRMRALESTIQSADWKVVAAVRLSHFLPFGMQNYAFGLTSIRFRTFVMTTWLVTLPGTAFQVYLGHLGFTSLDAWRESSLADWQTWTMRLGGLAVVAAAAGYVGHLAHSIYRRSVRQQLEREVESEQHAAAARNGWPVGTLALISLSCVSAALAVGTYTQRDDIRSFMESSLEQSARRIEEGRRS